MFLNLGKELTLRNELPSDNTHPLGEEQVDRFQHIKGLDSVVGSLKLERSGRPYTSLTLQALTSLALQAPTKPARKVR